MQIRLASPLQTDSIVDGEGIRTVLWTQGCSHHCKGCHNPGTHAFDGGFSIDTEELKQEIAKLRGQDGITLSGGDPFFQINSVLEIATYCQEIGLNVWAYTGFTFEQLQERAIKNPNLLKLLQKIDVLVDGKFEIEQKSLNLYFRGSRNQRIIDVPKSLKYNKVIEIRKYKQDKKEEKQQYGKMEFVYI